MNIILIGTLGYVAAQFLVGVWVSSKIKNDTDYFLAGRSLGVSLASFSIFATWFGAETCIGSAGAIYAGGISNGRADPFGYTFALLALAIFIVVPLWKKGYSTIGDLFRERFSGSVEKLAVIIMIPTSIFWAAAQIRAFGQVLSSTGGIDLSVAQLIAVTMVILYTASGGILADVYTDFIQGICITAGLIVLGYFIFRELGSPSHALESIDATRKSFLGDGSESAITKLDHWMVPILGNLMCQEIISRVLSCRSAPIARKATYVGAAMYLVIGSIPALIGLVGPNLIPNLGDPEQVLPTLAARYMPTVLYVLFSGAIISAILSTVDSTLLAVSALVSKNLLSQRFQSSLPTKSKIRIGRLGVALSGVIAYALSVGSESIYELIETSSSLGSAGILVVGCMGLFSHLGGKWAGIATLIVGVMGNWFATHVLGLSAPYLFTIGASLGCFLLVGMIEYLLLAKFETEGVARN